MEWINEEKGLHEETVVNMKIGVKEDRKTKEYSINFINMETLEGHWILVNTKIYTPVSVKIPNTNFNAEKSVASNVMAKDLDAVFSDIQTELAVNKNCKIQFIGRKSIGTEGDETKVNYRLNYSDVKSIVIIENVKPTIKGKK